MRRLNKQRRDAAMAGADRDGSLSPSGAAPRSPRSPRSPNPLGTMSAQRPTTSSSGHTLSVSASAPSFFPPPLSPTRAALSITPNKRNTGNPKKSPTLVARLSKGVGSRSMISSTSTKTAEPLLASKTNVIIDPVSSSPPSRQRSARHVRILSTPQALNGSAMSPPGTASVIGNTLSVPLTPGTPSETNNNTSGPNGIWSARSATSDERPRTADSNSNISIASNDGIMMTSASTSSLPRLSMGNGYNGATAGGSSHGMQHNGGNSSAHSQSRSSLLALPRAISSVLGHVSSEVIHQRMVDTKSVVQSPRTPFEIPHYLMGKREMARMKAIDPTNRDNVSRPPTPPLSRSPKPMSPPAAPSTAASVNDSHDGDAKRTGTADSITRALVTDGITEAQKRELVEMEQRDRTFDEEEELLEEEGVLVLSQSLLYDLESRAKRGRHAQRLKRKEEKRLAREAFLRRIHQAATSVRVAQAAAAAPPKREDEEAAARDAVGDTGLILDDDALFKLHASSPLHELQERIARHATKGHAPSMIEEVMLSSIGRMASSGYLSDHEMDLLLSFGIPTTSTNAAAGSGAGKRWAGNLSSASPRSSPNAAAASGSTLATILGTPRSSSSPRVGSRGPVVATPRRGSVAARDAAIAAAAAANQRGDFNFSKEVKQSDLIVLIVDDDDTRSDASIKLLNEVGYHRVLRCDTDSAVFTVTSNPAKFDVALLCSTAPIMLALVEQIRLASQLRHLAVVVLANQTVYERPLKTDNVRALIRAGVEGLILASQWSPTCRAQLMTILEHSTRRARTRANRTLDDRILRRKAEQRARVRTQQLLGPEPSIDMDDYDTDSVAMNVQQYMAHKQSIEERRKKWKDTERNFLKQEEALLSARRVDDTLPSLSTTGLAAAGGGVEEDNGLWSSRTTSSELSISSPVPRRSQSIFATLASKPSTSSGNVASSGMAITVASVDQQLASGRPSSATKSVNVTVGVMSPMAIVTTASAGTPSTSSITSTASSLLLPTTASFATIIGVNGGNISATSLSMSVPATPSSPSIPSNNTTVLATGFPRRDPLLFATLTPKRIDPPDSPAFSESPTTSTFDSNGNSPISATSAPGSSNELTIDASNPMVSRMIPVPSVTTPVTPSSPLTPPVVTVGQAAYVPSARAKAAKPFSGHGASSSTTTVVPLISSSPDIERKTTMSSHTSRNLGLTSAPSTSAGTNAANSIPSLPSSSNGLKPLPVLPVEAASSSGIVAEEKPDAKALRLFGECRMTVRQRVDLMLRQATPSLLVKFPQLLDLWEQTGKLSILLIIMD
jgi:DNA-binding NarL/FixJ family response regulator